MVRQSAPLLNPYARTFALTLQLHSDHVKIVQAQNKEKEAERKAKEAAEKAEAADKPEGPPLRLLYNFFYNGAEGPLVERMSMRRHVAHGQSQRWTASVSRSCCLFCLSRCSYVCALCLSFLLQFCCCCFVVLCFVVLFGLQSKKQDVSRAAQIVADLAPGD